MLQQKVGMFFIQFGFLVFLDATKTIEGWMVIDLCPTATSDLQVLGFLSGGADRVSPIWILMSDNTYNFDATNFSLFNALNHLHLLC